MDEKQFNRLETKLDIITKLLALNILQGKSITQQIESLNSAGLRVTDIAKITGKTENHVSVALNRLKKAKEKQNEKEPQASPSQEGAKDE